MASLDKRVRPGKGGKLETTYRVRFKDTSGVRRERGFVRRSVAVDFMEGLSANRPEGVRQDDAGLTFAHVAERFLQACERGRDGGEPLERQTVRGYRQEITARLTPLLGARAITSITRADVREIRDTLVTGAARSSARRQLFLLKAILRHAEIEELIPRAPVDGIRVRRNSKRLQVESKAGEVHQPADMTLILAAARQLRQQTGRQAFAGKCWIRFETMLNVLVYAGLRMSELRGLPVDAVDLEASTVKVYQKADLSGLIGRPKSSAAYRTIHIPASVTAMLKDWIPEGAPKAALVFGTDSGKPISHSALTQRMWNTAQEAAGVKRLNPHSTRHFFASLMIDQGMNLKALSEVLGHSDPMFTLRVYGHLFTRPEDVALREEMARKMAATLAEPEDDD